MITTTYERNIFENGEKANSVQAGVKDHDNMNIMRGRLTITGPLMAALKGGDATFSALCLNLFIKIIPRAETWLSLS